MIQNPAFARDEFAGRCQEILNELREAMAPGKYDLEQFNELLLELMTPDQDHNSENHPEFYLWLHEMINEELQRVASQSDIDVSMVMLYMSRIQFSGYGPVFGSDPVANAGWVSDVEPVFDVFTQDEVVCPAERLAFRVKVTADNKARVIVLAATKDIAEKHREVEARLSIHNANQKVSRNSEDIKTFQAAKKASPPAPKKPSKPAASPGKKSTGKKPPMKPASPMKKGC